jgi:putative addiction module component (TIGR02574 family)
MAPDTLEQLLKLPASERAEIAMALWESLSDADRDAEFEMTPELAAELDRRWQEHLDDPGSAVPWEVVEKRLRDRA